MKAVLDDWRTAHVDDRLRAMLAFIEKLTLEPESLTAADATRARDAGVTRGAMEDAIHVCTLFSVYDRLADSFKFHIPDAEGFAQSARTLLGRGYT